MNEHETTGKLVAVLSGGDWYDASVEHLVLLKPMTRDELEARRVDWLSTVGAPPNFSDWLISERLARGATDSDVFIVAEDDE